ncbi:hypothetical protein GIB67_032542 [Kingdonia uniflora]|uniref:Uncharacterized protein n=1 Tax=Kingdonia uniflora TaxID=39325 RepID=A0A7J7L7Y5_9MAGN|nr:hypothetical protein GIB67_032542 [Kingdonia uniflora]
MLNMGLKCRVWGLLHPPTTQSMDIYMERWKVVFLLLQGSNSLQLIVPWHRSMKLVVNVEDNSLEETYFASI